MPAPACIIKPNCSATVSRNSARSASGSVIPSSCSMASTRSAMPISVSACAGEAPGSGIRRVVDGSERDEPKHPCVTRRQPQPDRAAKGVPDEGVALEPGGLGETP